jgi:predicted HicB family RNase H-like nuclease
MKFTVKIEDELERQVRAVAILDGRPVDSWVSNLLRAGVDSSLEEHHSRVQSHPDHGSL